MSERRDDTPEQAEPSPAERRPGSYYYDDSTGYEVYNPEDEDESNEEEDPAKGHAP